MRRTTPGSRPSGPRWPHAAPPAAVPGPHRPARPSSHPPADTRAFSRYHLGDKQRREKAMAGRDFDGWTVLVTGASTGLGRAVAVECASRGAVNIVINFASS